MPSWSAVEHAIEDSLGMPFRVTASRPISGGCINEAWWVSDGAFAYFVKRNAAARQDMLQAEYDGLMEIAQSETIRVPLPVAVGADAASSFLVTEFLPMGGRVNPQSLAQALARMHRHTQGQFGWWRDNTIGLTAQRNDLHTHWPEFFADCRLGGQLRLAQANNAPSRLIDRGFELAESLAALFRSYRPLASLLHGDLWSGNYACLQDGTAVIFDPAVYYGDHETDLAMMELFGHPGDAFFAEYADHFPIDEGYPVRRTLYNAYHIVNHYNLFGGAYATQAERLIDRVLSEIR